MPEKDYRASRGARVLGNPTAYQIMKTLSLTKPLTPTELAKKLGLSLANVSRTLRILRLAEFVRYKTFRKEKMYWIKDRQIIVAMQELEKFMEKMKFKRF